MKKRTRIKSYVVALSAVFAVSSAMGTLVAYDNFNYTLGTTIAAGGTLGSVENGFANAWKFDSTGLSGEVVSGLGFAGVESSGSALKISNGEAGKYLFRGLTDTLTSGSYYMSMLFFRDDANGGGSENWSWQLKHSSSYSSGPGGSTKATFGSTSGEQASVLVAGGSSGTGVVTYNVGSTVFMLAKFTISDSGSETASMKWYNTGDTVPTSDPTWDATSTGEFSGGKGWRFNLPAFIQSMTIDEFKMGTELVDVIPEPTSLALLGVVGGAVLFIRRKLM